MLIRRHRDRLKEFSNPHAGVPDYEAGKQDVDAAPVPEPGEPDEEAAEEAGDDRPAGNASKADWVAYAVTQGADPDEAEGLSRDELREQYGA